MSAFVPVSPDSKPYSEERKRKRPRTQPDRPRTQPDRMFGSRIHVSPPGFETPPPNFSMPPPARRRNRSPTFSEGDGTKTATEMVNLLTLKQNKDKAAMEFIRYKNLEDEFNEWYKNKP